MISAKPPRIFGTGLIALDLVIGAAPETPVRCWAGGTCGNVLSILAWLGWDAYPVARMGGDAASERVRADMERWGVHVEWTTCDPTCPTPIVVQQIRRGQDGRPRHRFSWSCPRCGEWLPPFRPITVNSVEWIKPELAGASVFFLDRLSRASLDLATEASARGAAVVFEPSTGASDKLMAEGLAVADVVKYADDRWVGRRGKMVGGSSTLLEVRTLGEAGLRYRHRFGRRISNWMHLSAVPAPRLATPAAPGTGARRASSPRLRSMARRGCAAPGLVACGQHCGTDRRSRRGIAASRVRGAGCTPLRVTHSRRRLRACRTGGLRQSRRIRAEADPRRLWPAQRAHRSEACCRPRGTVCAPRDLLGLHQLRMRWRSSRVGSRHHPHVRARPAGAALSFLDALAAQVAAVAAVIVHLRGGVTNAILLRAADSSNGLGTSGRGRP